jgi:phosphoglycolate phosphatase
MARLVLFDFDGTIAASMTHIRMVLEGVAASHGITMDFDELQDHPTKEYIGSLGIPLAKIPFVLVDLRKRLKERFDAKPVTGMIPLLRELSNDHLIGIVSSNSKVLIQDFCAAHRLDFIEYIEEDASLFGKDGHIRKIMALSGTDAEDAVYIGDEERDIESAHKAGIKCISVTWGLKTKRLLEAYNPGMVVDTPDQLKDAIMDLRS